MEEIFEKYYDSIEKLMDESEEIKTTYDAKITEEERKLGELKTQESLMVIGSKLKEEKREEIDSKNKEITDLKSAKDARSKYISDTSESIRNQIKKDLEDKMSKFKTKSEMEEAKKALEDKSNEAKEAQEKFENESKKVKELIAQKEALINERKKLDDLINNYGLYDNESTRNEIIEKIKAKQTEIETTAKGAIDFMDKGEELKSEKEKMETEFNSYKPVSENVSDYEKLERLSYRTMNQTSFKLEDVKKELEDWKESKEKAKSSKSEKENSEVKEDMEKTNTSSREMSTESESKSKTESFKDETSKSKDVKVENSKEQPIKHETSKKESTKTEKENKKITENEEINKESAENEEINKESAENKISEIKISAKDDGVYVDGRKINNLGIVQSLEDKKSMFKRLGINDEIKNAMGKSSLFKKIFTFARIKSKIDPTIINLINRQSEKVYDIDKKSGEEIGFKKIGEEIGLSISDYIKSIITKEELPVKLVYDLNESGLKGKSNNKTIKYAKYAKKIEGVEVEGLKKGFFERLTSGLTASRLITGETVAEKMNQDYKRTERDINDEEKNNFRNEMKVDKQEGSKDVKADEINKETVKQKENEER